MPAPLQERVAQEYQAFYRLTGEFIREWAEFELYLSWPLSALLMADEWRARVILGTMRSFRAKLELITQLSATFASDYSNKKVVKFAKSAKSMSENRNMLAHQMGGVDERTKRLIFLNDKADLERGTDFLGEKRIDAANIQTWIKETNVLKGECIQLFKGRCSVVYALPKIHREKYEIQMTSTQNP